MINISDRIYGIDLILKKENKRTLVTLLRLSGSQFTVVLSLIRFPFTVVRCGLQDRRPSENKIFFPRSRKAKIITNHNHMNTLKYFEDYNLSLSKRSVYPAYRGRRDWRK